ncbi:hypothetical protein ABZ858_26880 [Streptomyces sp. NPDC047017]|uniref:hypothetical protein n=1 Tax=Streptomyces sp. NPDC047017 TaxID=3155024 RepID=UPI0034011248
MLDLAGVRAVLGSPDERGVPEDDVEALGRVDRVEEVAGQRGHPVGQVVSGGVAPGVLHRRRG